MEKNKENKLSLLRCLTYRFSFWSAGSRIQEPKKIVIIQMAQLGDMVCSTPMFRAVKSKYPKCKVLVVGKSAYRELLAGNNDVDEYINLEDSDESIIERLRSENIDFGCSTTPSFKALAYLWMGNVRHIAVPLAVGGYCPTQTRTYRILAKFVKKIIFPFGQYAPALMLKLLVPAGINSSDTRKHLFYTPDATNKINLLLGQHDVAPGERLFGISPSVGNKIKNWGGANFAKVANFIASKYNTRIVIIGHDKDETELKAMLSGLGVGVRVVNLFNDLSLDELKALMSKLEVFIAVDTGPIYIAEAFGISTVDILGPLDENEQPPIGPKSRIVYWNGRKSPAIHILNAREYDEKEALRQVSMITPDMVMREIESLMEEKGIASNK